MSAVMLLPGTNGSLLFVQRTVTRTIVLQETIGKGEVMNLGLPEYLVKPQNTLFKAFGKICISEGSQKPTLPASHSKRIKKSERMPLTNAVCCLSVVLQKQEQSSVTCLCCHHALPYKGLNYGAKYLGTEDAESIFFWKQPRCPSTEEWIRKMWYIYTMEYYAAEKNNDTMKFAGKWMELENVILSE
ncbi:hypothetical protein STEG23_020123, partial [Scotinomys teguina]